MGDEREEIARLIALAGLGTTDGSRRGMPENWGDEALWGARILECIPTEAAERCFELTDAILARQGPGPGEAVAYQARVARWMLACFTPEIAQDVVERNDRFIEEALELVQANGYSAERAHALVDYVFGRPVGEPDQEVGGVMVTLAALCNAARLDMFGAAQREIARIEDPGIMAKIKAKQAAKPTGSALPVAATPTREA